MPSIYDFDENVDPTEPEFEHELADGYGKHPADESSSPKDKGTYELQKIHESNAERGELKQQMDSYKEKMAEAKKNYNRAQHALAIMKQGLILVGSTLADPLFWILVILFVAIILIIAVAQTVGKNENAEGCGGATGDSSVLVNSSGPYNEAKNMNNMGSYLMATAFQFNGGKPLAKEQASAMIGNWMEESGLDPTITQGGAPGKPGSGWCPNCDNDKILAGGASSGRAIGFAQWDGSRKIALVKFAQSKGKQWSDLGVQIEYLKSELDGDEGKALAKSEFVQAGLTPEKYAEIFNRTFERSADFSNKRANNAKTVMSTMQGGTGIDTGGDSTTGGSCTMQDGNFDNSGVVKLAISIAYPLEQKQSSFTQGGDVNGCSVATPAYKAAKAAAEKKTQVDDYSEGGPCKELYASCDRFVATVLRLTVDPNVPWGSSDTQHDYFAQHPEKWQAFHKKSEAKPGAVITTNGHILLYVGQVNGKDSIAQASHRQYVARIDNSSQITEDLKDTYEGRQYIGYNFIGSGGGAAAAAEATSQAAK